MFSLYYVYLCFGFPFWFQFWDCGSDRTSSCSLLNFTFLMTSLIASYQIFNCTDIKLCSVFKIFRSRFLAQQKNWHAIVLNGSDNMSIKCNLKKFSTAQYRTVISVRQTICNNTYTFLLKCSFILERIYFFSCLFLTTFRKETKFL